MEILSTVPSLRILLVEDNEHDRLAFHRAFHKSDVQCEIAECVRAEEALLRIGTDGSSFDVVVVDHKLPGMPGLELCKELLRKKVPLPLVLFTGKGSERLAVEALKAGVDDYVIKDPADRHLDLLPVVLPDVVRKHEDHMARKRAEAEILRSKTMLQAVFDGISDPLVMLDRDLVVKRLNRPAALYYDVEFRDAIEKPCHLGLRGEPEPCEGCTIHSALLSGLSVTVERKGLTDPARLEQVVIYPVKEENGQVGCAIIRISDITEVRFMERQLMRSEKLASIGRLAAGVAHEINNPLNNISTSVQILLEELEDPDLHFKKQLLRETEAQIERARDIVKALLEFSRERSFSRKTVQFKELIAQTLKLIKGEIPANMRIEVDVPDSITAEIDPRRIQQVLINLILNGAQAMDDGGNLYISAWEKEGNGGFSFQVRDTGKGISPGDLPKIFDPFFTTKDVGHRDVGQGAGLGLAVSQGIIEQHGGKIGVESEVGKGTIFTVFLPHK